MVDLMQQIDLSSIGHVAQHAIDMNGWSIDSFLSNLGTSLKRWAGRIMTVIGIVAIIVAVWFGFKIVTDKQQRGKWIVDFLIALTFAGLFLTGGYALFKSMSGGISSSVKDMGR